MAKTALDGTVGNRALPNFGMLELGDFDNPLAGLQFADKRGPRPIQPSKQCGVCAVADPQPYDLCASGIGKRARDKVFIFGDHNPSTFRSELPNLGIRRVAQCNFSHRTRFKSL